MGYDSTNPAYKFKVRDIYEEISQADLNQLERFADKLFSKVGIDVEFTRHFLDRVNDERNKKPISSGELTRLFKQEYKKWGKPIAQMGPDQEAVMKDLQTDINMPFALQWDSKNNELDLVAKTVMRKKDFKTTNKEFPVEGEIIPNPANTIAVNTKSDGDFYGLSKYMGDLSKADKDKFGRSDSAAIISFYDPRELELVINRIKKYTGLDAKEIAGFVDPGDLKWSIGRMMDCTNFYHKNIVEKRETGDVRTIDPAVLKMFNKARARFPQARTDLEAFIKFMQDDHSKDNRAFDQLAKRQTDAERKIKDLETKVNRARNKKLFQSKSTKVLHNIAEEWSKKYKDSINCSNPKGFSQKAHCAGKKKNETKEAPDGTYFTKSGNLVKGKLTKDAKAKGARQTDPKDNQRSKVPAVSQYNEDLDSMPMLLEFILQSPRPGIRIIIRKHTDGKRFVFKTMTQNTPGEPKILDKVTAQKQLAALMRMGWKKEMDEGTRCWKGYTKKGMKTMFGKRVPNCVKNESHISESEHSDRAGQIAADSVKGSIFSSKDDLESALSDALPDFPDKDYDRSKAVERAMEILYDELDDMISESLEEGKRIPRKKGQKANSKKHSDLYTDENPKGTIHGLKFATVKDAEASVRKIKSSGKKHAHKIQAAVAMEQRAKAAGKKSAASVYRKYINSMKKKTNEAGVGIITKQNATKDVPIGGEYMNVKKIFPGQKRPVPLTGKAKKKDK